MAEYGLTKFKLNRAGVVELLRSDGVLADLKARGERVASAAGEGMELEARVGAGRARVSIRTATFDARLAEAEDRTLTRAIDAAR